MALSFFLGTKSRSFNLPKQSDLDKMVASPQPEIKPSLIPTVTPKQSVATPKPTTTSFDYKDYFKKMFPSDMPVYPGANMIETVNQGSCKQELLKERSDCLQVMFIFKVSSKDNSVEKIVNWYVSNPTPGWTYRGVYGDQRDYQSGDIYKKDLYYRLIYRYPNPGKDDIEIDYNGPYPISDLSPKP